MVPIRARTARAKCRVEKEAIYTGKRDTASEESKAKEIESLSDVYKESLAETSKTNV